MKNENEIINLLKSIEVKVDSLQSSVSELNRYKKAQAEGIKRAKMRGTQFGRSKLDKPEGYNKYKKKIQAGEISIRKAAEFMGVSRSTLSTWLAEDQES